MALIPTRTDIGGGGGLPDPRKARRKPGASLPQPSRVQQNENARTGRTQGGRGVGSPVNRGGVARRAPRTTHPSQRMIPTAGKFSVRGIDPGELVRRVQEKVPSSTQPMSIPAPSLTPQVPGGGTSAGDMNPRKKMGELVMPPGMTPSDGMRMREGGIMTPEDERMLGLNPGGVPDREIHPDVLANLPSVQATRDAAGGSPGEARMMASNMGAPGGGPVTDPNALAGRITPENTLRGQRIGFDVDPGTIDPRELESRVRERFMSVLPALDQSLQDRFESFAGQTSALGRTGSGMFDEGAQRMHARERANREQLLGDIAFRAAEGDVNRDLAAQQSNVGNRMAVDTGRVRHLLGERANEDALARQAMNDEAMRLRFLQSAFAQDPTAALNAAAQTGVAGAGMYGTNAGMLNQQLAEQQAARAAGAGSTPGAATAGGGVMSDLVERMLGGIGGTINGTPGTPPIMPSEMPGGGVVTDLLGGFGINIP